MCGLHNQNREDGGSLRCTVELEWPKETAAKSAADLSELHPEDPAFKLAQKPATAACKLNLDCHDMQKIQ